jgi:hypothetical protein
MRNPLRMRKQNECEEPCAFLFRHHWSIPHRGFVIFLSKLKAFTMIRYPSPLTFFSEERRQGVSKKGGQIQVSSFACRLGVLKNGFPFTGDGSNDLAHQNLCYSDPSSHLRITQP